jgi:hypothetical protein
LKAWNPEALQPRLSGAAMRTANSNKSIEITGTVPATCSDFKIDRPSFLMVPIHNEIPVTVDTTWRAQSSARRVPQPDYCP